MDIKMHSIKAGPDGCADAGATIRVSQEEGDRLIAQKFASKATRFPVREKAAIDPQATEQKEREEAAERQRLSEQKEAVAKSSDSVSAAMGQLDAVEDDDWTAGGKPSMDRLKGLTGSQTLTRAEVDFMFPEFRRPKEPGETGAQTGTQTGTQTGAVSESGARSNKP